MQRQPATARPESDPAQPAHSLRSLCNESREAWNRCIGGAAGRGLCLRTHLRTRQQRIATIAHFGAAAMVEHGHRAERCVGTAGYAASRAPANRRWSKTARGRHHACSQRLPKRVGDGPARYRSAPHRLRRDARTAQRNGHGRACQERLAGHPVLMRFGDSLALAFFREATQSSAQLLRHILGHTLETKK